MLKRWKRLAYAMMRRRSRASWQRLIRLFTRRISLDAIDHAQLPLRAQLFSAEQMERHGRKLAAAHQCDDAPAPDQLIPRLAENERVLRQARETLTQAVRAHRLITPASEWLLDNFYLIEEQVLTARRHLPKNYSRQLPRLTQGPSAGYPRVYDLALQAISHGDGRIDAESLSRFVAAYQSVTPLRLGELWAFPIMLRLALIENLRRVGARVLLDCINRNIADDWADRLTEVADAASKDLVLIVADMARSHPPLTSAFVAELARRLQGKSSSLALPLTWIEHWLGESEQSIERMVHVENQHQAADQVTISNSIGSIRFLAMMDWREFVETMSVVEDVLRRDPAGAYVQMTFASRDRYRHLLERVARRSELSEIEVADKALELSRQAALAIEQRAATGEAVAVDGADDAHDPARAHIGWYLIDDGLIDLQRAVGMRPTFGMRVRRIARKSPLLLYLFSIGAIVAAFLSGFLSEQHIYDAPKWVPWLVALLGLIAFSDLGISVVNWAVTLIVGPRRLPRMDFSEGIPASARTVVVVPTMLTNIVGIDALIEALEVRFLANRDAHLHFVLLTDFLDADSETLPEDAELLAHAAPAIERLNRKYAADGNDIFVLLHRPRRWNPSERKWMGHERKRGKLSALNRLLRSSDRGDFSLIVGHTQALRNVRYVITLDTDTQLPRDAAREFVGTLAHPLNRPRFGPAKTRAGGREVRGYGILQPRVGVSLGGGRLSRYARLFGSEPGIDPYTRAVSDVYQDVFGEGSFVGKGIYDVDAFERALDGRFPDNSILSHDLLEGCYARAGLISDVQLYEDYPGRYAADVKRRQRWIRGDWQLLPWLLPWTRRQGGRRELNPLTWLSRGKILDNLRRSLASVALTALLLIGWLLAAKPLEWTLWLLAIVLVPPLLTSMMDLLRKPAEMPLPAHLLNAWRNSARSLSRAPITLACLPYEAAFILDAIARTLWRMAISRRNLLQWAPSSEVERTLGNSLGDSVRRMWIAPALAIGVAAALLLRRPEALVVASPILALWLLAPGLMWWLSLPRERERAQLSPGQNAFLERLARRTWAFFEVYVGPEDNWLPPDNMQANPETIVAHRTSPTNIGMVLLANLAAADFGFIGSGELLARTARTLETMQRMQRYRGHFYNWYDTRTLEPLRPHYISTVDSGNLAGHLLTLRQGILALADAPLLRPTVWIGLRRTLAILREALDKREPPALGGFERELDAACAAPPAELATCIRYLQTAAGYATEIGHETASLDDEAAFWIATLQRQCGSLLSEAQTWGQSGFDLRSTNSLREASMIAIDALPALARERLALIDVLSAQIAELARMEYAFLYDRGRHLLSIGYNVDEQRLDPGYYDLLASEARLCSFVAIAQGQLPQESWFALGRQLSATEGDPVLLSWSGSMFEYLMPQLVMPSYEDSLLDQTARSTVDRQIDYGELRGVPWGISESGYNTVDAHLNYQYRAFGVPGLGLKRGLAQDLVIAPYASMLALMVAPEAACENLQRLAADERLGRFGFYEAIDYTSARTPRGQDSVTVRSFMAHHQGMGLLALAYLLLDQPMQQRFASDPELQATLLLLQERIPKIAIFHPHAGEAADQPSASEQHETHLRIFATPASLLPAVQMLSNGRYHVMLTSAGGGFSRLGDIALNRWREDFTRDPWGIHCYLRDVASGEFWSSAFQPTCVPVQNYEAIFSDARAEFRGRKLDYDMHTEIAVSPEDDIELRRLRIVNRSRQRRTIEITTYAEVVLAPAISDELHPAFSNLFVQTELIRAKQAIVCTRRPRSHDEAPPWMLHLLAVHDVDINSISYETDRARFIGRTRSLADPRALELDERLSDSDGSVLDPMVAIRCRITLQPGQIVQIDQVFGIAATREDCVRLIDKYRDRRLADRVFDLAWTHSQVVRRQINASQSDAQLYERLAGLVIYSNGGLRAGPHVLMQNRRGQAGLWGQTISGDLPIVLVQIADADNIELVRQLVQAHAYWRLKGLAVDLVIWNEDQAGYRQQLQDQIMGLIAAGVEAHVMDRPGGIFVRLAQQMSLEDRVLLQSVARVIVSDADGSLSEQINRRRLPDALPMPLLPLLALPAPVTADAVVLAWPFDDADEKLQLDNGIGGFSADGREYVITLEAGEATPMPWANVLANAKFGCVLSESGVGYTWGENAHEFRLTPWHNDPVTDAGGEAYYLRDDESGRVWSPTPLPRRGAGRYQVRHGFGYSSWRHVEAEIASELTVHVDASESVKFAKLHLRNLSSRGRRLSATGYIEWVLGDLRARSQPHLLTEHDFANGVILARNPYNTEFEGRTGFFDADSDATHVQRSVSGDRAEFIGRNGSLRDPAALKREQLSGRVGAGLDACAAIMLGFELDPGGECTIVFRLGVARNSGKAIALAQRMQGAAVASASLDAIKAQWLQTLGTIQVSTPDPAFDLLANGWLLYQTIACRYLARSGYYQSGGAFGFRDQLQDAMAMVHAQPARVREHLLLCAAHQFPEGDVQHWWHPPLDRGVRTRCSDDYLWLPFAVCRYLQVTGDTSVLNESVRYIDGRAVNPDEESYYDLPLASMRRDTLYQHCVRALQRGLKLLGAQGLPLIATGDWNDGMNRVGEAGRGESVWLGFFLFDALQQFSTVARGHGDAGFADHCLQSAEQMRGNLEQHAWDGDWYRRAWYDDGTPLGSTSSDACQIDSIAQSWSVLSGAGDPKRVRQAMASLDKRLVRRDAGLIQLLDPPFDLTASDADTGQRLGHDPGYIAGYVPGVRENGGQYTHAAIWTVMAFARLGNRERAWELLRMINPVHHALTPEDVALYKVEPYVLAADVYAVAPHIGRGGWTWYTGSAGWMYRLMVESLLGLDVRGDRLRIAPCIPDDWPSYVMDYRHGNTLYRIKVVQGSTAGGKPTLLLDGAPQDELAIPLVDDGREHQVDVRIGIAASVN